MAANRTIAVQVQFNGINEATNSIAALTAELTKLKNEQKKADPTSQEFAELSKQIAAVSGSLQDLTVQQKAANQAFQDSKLAAGSYAALRAETKLLEAEIKAMAVGVNATQAEYDALKTKIRDNNAEIAKFNADLKASSKEQVQAVQAAVGSLAQMRDLVKDLRAQQALEDPASARYKELADQIAFTTSNIKALEDEQKKLNKSFEESKAAAGSYAALKAETKALETQFKSMAVGVNATQEEYDQVLAKIKENNLEITRLNREMRNSASIAQRFKEGAVAAFKEVATAIAAGTAALVGFDALKGIGELGFDLERGFAQVNTVAQLTEEQMATLKDQVLETAKDSTVNLEEVPGALFKILSATGDVAESQKILEASLKAAKVGFTDLTSASDAGSQIFGAVKGQVKDINEVFDVLFRTQKEGVLTFADLAKEIPRIVPSANQAGFAFKEVSGALATVTKAGLDANQSATVLDAAFREIADPAKQKGFKAIGASIFDAAGQTRPLIEVITDLNKSFEGLNAEEKANKLKQIGLGGEASKGIGILVDNIETLGTVTDSVVNGSLGEFDRQLAASQNTADDLKSATNNLKVTLIQQLQPAFETVGITVVNLIRGFAQLIGFFLENKGIVLLLASAYLALNAAQVQNFAILVKQRALRLALLVIDKSEAAFLAIKTAATTAYGVAQSLLAGRLTLAAAAQQLFNLAMAANPVGLAIAGVTALAGALLIFTNRSKEASEAEKQRAATAQLINESLKATTEEIGKETAGIESLVRGIRDETKSKQEKKAITDQLLSQYGKYLTELDKEAVKAGNVEAAYRKIKSAITENIIARQKSEAVEKLFSEQLAIQTDATFKLGKAFGTNAADAQAIVQAFEGLAPAIQQATASGKNLQLIDVKSLTEVEQKAVQIFTKIGAQQREAEALGRKSPVVAQLERFRAATQALDEGIVDIDKKFSTLGGTMEAEMGAGGDAIDETTASVAELEKQLSALQATQKETARNSKDWQEQQKEIDKVKAAIERITGASKESAKASKDAAKEAGKAAQEDLELAEKRTANLLELRRQLSDALLENEDDQTAKLLQAEQERYAKQQQLALDNAAKITLDVKASQEEVQEATRIQDAILEQLQIEHYGKLNEIAADGLRQELETQAAADAQRVAQQTRINDLSLEAVETELANETKNFERRRKLIRLQGEFQIKALEMETMAQLKAAQTDEERTKVMEVEAQKRIAIVKDVQAKLEAEKGTLEQQFARVLGISPEELAKFQDVFKEGLQVLSQAIDQFFQARLAAIDVLIDNQQKRIDLAAEAAEKQVERVASLEERLATATGARRERLIALIDQERQRERALFAEKVKQEKAKAAIEAQKIEIENKQAKIRKAQAIAQAVANTAVGITRTIAEVPKVDFGVSTAILIGLYAALGAAQVALIASQKFAKGGKVDGPSHDQGGVPMAVPSQNRYVELEGGEFVTNKRATERNADVLDLINREGHRTSFTIEPRKFANGGAITPTPNFASVNAAIANQNGGVGISEAKVDRMIDLLAIVAAKDPELNVVEFSRRLQSVRVTEQRGKAF